VVRAVLVVLEDRAVQVA